MMKKENFPVSKLYLMLYCLIMFAVFFAASCAVLYFTEKEVRSSNFEYLEQSETNSVKLGQDLLTKEITEVISDLNYLVKTYKINAIANEDESSLKQTWEEFSYQREKYDRIQFVDVNGDEKINIDFVDGMAAIVSADNLTNIKELELFQSTKILNEGDIYISPIQIVNSNQSDDALPRFIISFSTPVYSDSGELMGMVVLNYLAGSVLETFMEVSDHATGELGILNADAEWIFSPYETLAETLTKTSLDDTFSELYPDEWEEIISGIGQTITDNGVFTYAPVSFTTNKKSPVRADEANIIMGGGSWYIVSLIDRNGDNADLFYDSPLELIKDVLTQNVWLFAVILSVSLLLVCMLYFYLVSYQKTKFYSQYDELTEVYNRREGKKKLDEIMLGKARANFLLSLCYLDVNGLKEVNDVLGHEWGDELITTVADIIKKQIRQSDFVVRMGGDEFLIVLSRINEETAEQVWQRIYDDFEKININEARPYIISVSHGVVSCKCGDSYETTDHFIKRADEKMYEEKRVVKEDYKAVREGVLKC